MTCIEATSGLIAISMDDDLETAVPPPPREEELFTVLPLLLLLLLFRAEENPPNVPMAVDEDKQPVKMDLKSGNWSE